MHCERDNISSVIVPSSQLDMVVNRCGGYSLIEVITIVVLIGISFPGLIGFFANSLDKSVKIEIINKAIFLAGEKMEKICTDKNEPSRGLPYIKTIDRYPVEIIDEFTISVSIQDIIRGGVDVTEVKVTVSNELLTNDFILSNFFTDYEAN